MACPTRSSPRSAGHGRRCHFRRRYTYGRAREVGGRPGDLRARRSPIPGTARHRAFPARRRRGAAPVARVRRGARRHPSAGMATFATAWIWTGPRNSRPTCGSAWSQRCGAVVAALQAMEIAPMPTREGRGNVAQRADLARVLPDVLYHFPDVLDQEFQANLRGIPWRNDEASSRPGARDGRATRWWMRPCANWCRPDGCTTGHA